MAYNADDVLRLTMVQEFDGQECLNVFYYKVNLDTLDTFTPAMVGELFWDHVKTNWMGNFAANLMFDRVIVENLDGDLSFGEFVIPTGERFGAYTGEPLGPFVAAAIQLNRTSRLTRHGHKRLVGLTETSVTTFMMLTSTWYTAVQLLADDFASNIMFGIVTTLLPVIVGFPNDNRPTRVEVNIDTATLKPQATTQNSRKRGHGH